MGHIHAQSECEKERQNFAAAFHPWPLLSQAIVDQFTHKPNHALSLQRYLAFVGALLYHHGFTATSNILPMYSRLRMTMGFMMNATKSRRWTIVVDDVLNLVRTSAPFINV